MSIEQKFLTIKENQPKIYKAAVNKYALKKTVADGAFAAVIKSAEYPVIDFKMEGNTEQKTYTGKNLFDVSRAKNRDNWVSGTYQYSPLNLPPGTYTWSVSANNMCKENANAVTLKAAFYLTTDPGVVGGNVAIGNSNVSNTNSSHTKTKQFTINAGEAWYFNLYINGGYSSLTEQNMDIIFDELFPNMQIEQGSTATEYEPYTGSKFCSQLFDISKFKSSNSFINNGDGTITCKGYAPSTSTNKISECCPGVKVGQSIVISGTGVSNVYFGGSINNHFTVTQAMLDDDRFGFYGASDSSANNPLVLSDIMINEGTTPLPYQPYDSTAKGLSPAPSPNYPQEIVNAGGVGKNLFDINAALNENSYVLVDMTQFGLTGTSLLISIKVQPNTSYNISATRNNATSNLRIYFNSGYTSLLNANRTISVGDSDTIYIGFYSTSAASTDTQIRNFSSGQYTNIQIEQGSAATEYEPFHYKFNFTLLGENILDTTKLQNGFITSTGGVENVTWYKCTDYIYIKGAKSIYTNTFTSTATNRFLVFYDENKTFISGRYQGMPHIDTVPSNAVYTRFNVSPSFAEPIVCLNHSPSEYSEYKEPVSFTLTSPVQLTKWDKLVKRDGVWGWSITSAEYVITKDMIPNVNNTSWADMALYTLYSTPLIGSQNEAFCKQFIFLKNPQTASVKKEAMDWNNKELKICFYNNNKLADTDSFKSYVTENPIHIPYQTAEEQSFHPLPDDEQELLNNLTMHYGGATLYNDQGCPMEIKYVVEPALI